MVRRLFDWLTRGYLRLAGLALILMVIQINLDVLGRYLFNSPLPATVETVSAYFMVATVFLPLARIEMSDGHISVDLLTQFLPPAARLRLQALACAIGAGYFGLLTVTSWQAAVAKYRIGEYVMSEYQVLVWPSRFFVPVGCGLIAALLAYKAWRLLLGDKSFAAEDVETGV